MIFFLLAAFFFLLAGMLAFIAVVWAIQIGVKMVHKPEPPQNFPEIKYDDIPRGIVAEDVMAIVQKACADAKRASEQYIESDAPRQTPDPSNDEWPDWIGD